MQSKIVSRVLSVILSVSLLMLQIGMPVVYAAESNPMQETKNITVPMGTAKDELPLPKRVTVADGSMMLLANSDAATYDINNGALTIDSSNLVYYNNAAITGSTSSESEQLTIDGVAVNLTTHNLSITMTGNKGNMSGITLKNGATLNLTVEGTNTLTGAYGGAGIDVPQGCTLNITAGSTGTLTAIGGSGYGGGAGIGAVGNQWTPEHSNTITQSVGTINIAGGTIIATGVSSKSGNNPVMGAAGIGGSCHSTTGTISITGGTVTATGGFGAAGIGGGTNGCVEKITITDGTVTATGTYDGSAIGSGYNGDSSGTLSCGTIELSGGVVAANGNIGYGGAYKTGNNVGGTVSIGSGAAVTVKDGVISPTAAGINTYPLSITIYDGRLINTIENASFTINGTTYKGSINVNEKNKGTLSCKFVVANGTLTGNQTATLSGNSYSWKGITCSEVSGGYSGEIGERLYPVYLCFYDPAITSDIAGATVSAQRSGISLNADSTQGIVQLVCDGTIVKQQEGVGKMAAWMPAGTGMNLSVTTSSLNSGSAMSKSAQTVKASTTDGTTITMLRNTGETDQITGALDLSYGSITFTENGGKLDITYTPTSGGNAITAGGQSYQNEYEIIQSTSETATKNKIIFEGTLDFVKVKLKGVNMTSQGKAIDLQTAKAQLNLSGSNTIDCGGADNNYMGIHAGEGSELTIDGSGSLEIKGIPTTGSGIGGYYNSGIGEGAGKIRIQGGTLTVSSIPNNPTSGCYGTAIGSSYKYSGDNPGDIYITGGTVNAIMYPYGKNYFGGAAIGGSYNGVCPSITISGGTVKANGEAFASIGKGNKGSGGSLVITGGTISTVEGGQPKINLTAKNGTAADSVLVYYTTADVSQIYGKNAAVTDASIVGASYGFNDVQTDANGVLHLYLPVSTEGTKSEAYFKDAYYSGAITSTESSNVLKKTILKKSPNLKLTGTVSGKVFDDTPISHSTVKGDLFTWDSGGVLSFTYFTDSNGTKIATANSGAAPKNAGTYYLKATLEENGEYAGSETDYIPFTIDKIPLNIEAVFTGGTYNGKPYTYTGTPTFKNGTEALSGITYTAKYAGRDGTTYDESETAPTNVGKYNLILTVSGESANTYVATTTIGFEITEKPPYIPPYVPPYTPPTPQPTTETRQVPVVVDNGGTNTNAVQVPVTRTTDSDGRKTDTVKFDEDKAKETVTKASETKTDTATISVTDIPGNNADKVEVQVPQSSMTELGSNNIGLDVKTEKLALELPKETVSALKDKDAKIQISEVKDNSEVEETKGLILKLASGSELIAAPLKIETNFTGRTKITLPIDTSKLPSSKEELDKFLSSLAVMVQHSDGENAIDKGTIVYDEKGKPIGISIWVNKFSDFTLVSLPESYFQGRTTVIKDKVAADKEWNIKFTKIADSSTITKDNVYVTDLNGKRVEVEVSYDSDNILKVTPVNPYKSGETYYLYISKSVKSKDKTSLVNELRYQFTIE